MKKQHIEIFIWKILTHWKNVVFFFLNIHIHIAHKYIAKCESQFHTWFCYFYFHSLVIWLIINLILRLYTFRIMLVAIFGKMKIIQFFFSSSSSSSSEFLFSHFMLVDDLYNIIRVRGDKWCECSFLLSKSIILISKK